MIVKRESGWIVAYSDDMSRELIRVKPPEGGFTWDEWERFRAHLVKVVAEREAKPN